MLRTHRSLEGLLCNPVRRKMRFFLLFHFNGTPVEWNGQGKTEVLWEKPVPVPLCPPQILHGPTRDRTRASVVRGRRLTAWAMARPTCWVTSCYIVLVQNLANFSVALVWPLLPPCWGFLSSVRWKGDLHAFSDDLRHRFIIGWWFVKVNHLYFRPSVANFVEK
jgi:hypothetical protein